MHMTRTGQAVWDKSTHRMCSFPTCTLKLQAIPKMLIKIWEAVQTQRSKTKHHVAWTSAPHQQIVLSSLGPTTVGLNTNLCGRESRQKQLHGTLSLWNCWHLCRHATATVACRDETVGADGCGSKAHVDSLPSIHMHMYRIANT
eukprot:5991258-Amphidinium_carterae.1